MKRPEEDDDTPSRPDPDLDEEYGEHGDCTIEETELDEQPGIDGAD